ncbi:MAG: molybdenum cofactor guanylyltransferase [Prolixibacteraceae bacterium]|nr:molybdenum cofactor guanylyltransferase [Prolixibacteraceae bacterium]
MITNITGVVLAGGKSSRMGTDKGLIDFKGKPMVQYSIDLLSDIFETVAISTNNPVYSQFGLPLIIDIHKNCGPMGGILAALSQIKTDKVFTISCDMPFVTRETIEKILLHQDAKIAVATHNDFIEPLCGIYSIDLLKKMNDRIIVNNFKMYSFILEEKSTILVPVSQNQFLNINSPEDLKSFNG